MNWNTINRNLLSDCGKFVVNADGMGMDHGLNDLNCKAVNGHNNYSNISSALPD